MKKVTINYSRENSATKWYAVSEQTKSAEYQAYRAFLEQNVDNLETRFNSQNEISVDMQFNDENYAQFETLYAAVESEIYAYNSANGITTSKTVTEI